MLAVLAIVPLPFSCDIIDGGGTCPDTGYFLNGFSSLQVNDLSLTNDTLEVSELTFDFNFDVSPMSTAMLPGRELNFGSFLIPSASALSCLGPHVTPYITSVSITSNRDFGSAYPADSNLRSLFDSIYIINEAGELVIDVINFEPNAAEALQGYCSLTLMELPEPTEVHVFSMKMELSDGTSYTMSTGPIRFI